MTEPFRVLVVDADAATRRMAAEALAGHCFRDARLEGDAPLTVDATDAPCDGCARISAMRPHVLVLDNELPCVSGADLLAQVREGRADMAVIMTEARPSYAAAVDVTRRGAFDFLPKPFTAEALRNAVDNALRHLVDTRRDRLHAAEKKRLRFEFVSVLAHELKAPLAAVESCLQVLEARALGPNLDDYGEFLARATRRVAAMRGLVGDLLDLTRVESGERPRGLEFMDAAAAARGVMETLEPEAREKGVSLALDAPEPMRVRADRWEFDAILSNLLSNAVKYNRKGGHAELSLALDGDHVVIAVSDTGIGMTEEEQGRLFQEFGRIRNRETENILGSGLGLSLVRKLAALYGGEVRVESAPGVGSRFTVTLRRCRGADLAE